MRRDQLQSYVDSLKPLLRLTDWVIDTNADATLGDLTAAEIHFANGRCGARVDFATDFWDRTPDEQRVIVVHELVHCHFRGTQDAMDTVADQLGNEGRTFACAMHQRAVEHGTDAVALALAPFVPLPPSDSEEVTA